MPLPAYQIAVLSPLSGAVVAIYDGTTLYDLRYSRSLNDVGTLAMTLPSTPEIRASFALDSFIEVYRADSTGALIKEETYLCRLTHRFIDQDEERFVVGGVSLNHLMMRRIIDPADDPGVVDGHSVKSGPADQVIYDLCNEQMGPGASINRRTPGLTITSQPLGRPVATSLRFEYLFNQVKTLAKTGVVDFQITRLTGSALELYIGVIGNDKTYGTNAPLGQPWVGLSPIRGNLTQPSLLSDRKAEGTYVYALGQGQGTNRVMYKSASADVLDSPFNRIEFVQDMRNVSKLDVQALQTGAEGALVDKGVHTEFTYEPTGIEPGNVYRDDWDLGDAVTVEWDEFLRDLRIIQVELSISESGETITTTVTDDFIFPGMPVVANVYLPIRATLWHYQATATVGTDPTVIVATLSQHYALYSFQNSHGNGDTFTQSVWLAAGTYQFSVLGWMGGVSGKLDWYMDDIYFTTQDWYASPDVANELKIISVVVVGDGRHVLKGVVNGKNASSGDYYVALTKYWFKQASDT